MRWRGWRGGRPIWVVRVLQGHIPPDSMILCSLQGKHAEAVQCDRLDNFHSHALTYLHAHAQIAGVMLFWSTC